MSNKGNAVSHLRLIFLVPLLLAILVIIITLAFSWQWYQYQNMEEGVTYLRDSARTFYTESLQQDTHALQAMMSILRRDQSLRRLLAESDREGLLKHTTALFAELQRDYAITHFYFTNANKENVLRMHAPEHDGQAISQIVIDKAIAQGHMIYGIDLTVLGTVTLRLVDPWYDVETGKLIGLVELGMDIAPVLERMRQFFDIEVVIMTHKNQLNRERWEQSVQDLNRQSDWDLYPTTVIANIAQNKVKPTLLSHLDELSGLHTDHSLHDVIHVGSFYRMAVLPIYNMAAHEIAHMVLFIDESHDIDTAPNMIYAGAIASASVGMLLILFFYIVLGSMKSDDDDYQSPVLYDSVTGLLLKTEFYRLLEKEVMHSAPLKDHLSVIVLAVDHFQKISDTHGQQVCDKIFRDLAKLLAEHVRNIDKICRYDDDQIVILMPKMNDQDCHTSERLRNTIEQADFSIKITASFGVATYPEVADTAESLLAAAMQAVDVAQTLGYNQVRCAGDD